MLGLSGRLASILSWAVNHKRARALARTRPASSQANAASRPDTSTYAFLDALLAFEEIGRIDVADRLRVRWSDVL
jgi:hypothetical protein